MSQVEPGRRVTRGHVELRGRTTWWNRYRIEIVDPQTSELRRRQTRMKLGRFRSEAAANAALDAYLARLEGAFVPPGPSVNFAQSAAKFDAERIPLMRPESQRTYRGLIRRYVLPEFGQTLLTGVDAARVQRMIGNLHQRGLAPATIAAARNRTLEILRHARRAGFATCTIERQDLRIPSTQTPDRDARRFNTEEFDRILEASTGARRALWAVLGLGGLRLGEGLGLCWRHVDLGTGTLYVRQAAVAGRVAAVKTKTSARDVPMLPRLLEEMRTYRAQRQGRPDDLLFATRRGTPRHGNDVRNRWLTPLLRKLDIPHGGTHAFRHYAARLMDEIGLGTAGIRAFLGHHNVATQARYTSKATEELRAQIIAAITRREAKP